MLARLRWRPHEADLAQLRGFAARYPHLPVWEAMLAALEWDLGNAEAARRGVALCARDDFAAVVRSPDFLPAALCLADPAAGAGEPWQVERLYELLLPHAAPNPVLSSCGAPGARSARGLGLLAAADDRPRRRRRALRRCAAACDDAGRPAWALRTIGDWLAPASPSPDRGRPGPPRARARGRARPADVAARIADEAQTITP